MNWRLERLDWEQLGRELRQSTIDAHGQIVDGRTAYQFLLDSPEMFLADDEDWPDEMPTTPPPALIAAYLGGSNG